MHKKTPKINRNHPKIFLVIGVPLSQLHFVASIMPCLMHMTSMDGTKQTASEGQ